MKLSDYLSSYISDHLVDTVFGYQGSSVCHIIDSLSQNPQLTFIETRHEQAAAFAANGYAQSRNTAGVAVASSGPGVINLISGIANAYYDSLPCLFISGQVSTQELKSDPDMRQYGFQETDIVSIVQTITKYAVQIRQPERIVYELEKAVYLMHEGRPGPVLLDIPHNVQRAQIQPDQLEHYTVPIDSELLLALDEACHNMTSIFRKSKRPVILLGGGSRKLAEHNELLTFLEGLSIPVVTSYRGKDVFDNTSPSYCGVIGVYGDRSANWAVKFSDMLLVLGSRLDGRQTGGNDSVFANDANVVMVDIDDAELKGKPAHYQKIHSDVFGFVQALSEEQDSLQKDGAWLSTVQAWRKRYPIEREYQIEEGVNPYHFLSKISEVTAFDTVFTVDVGQNQTWANTSLMLGPMMKLIQSSGLGSMGYALPAAIGSYYARPTQTVCICGDGGFQMNLQELQTVAHNHIPIKMVILNNQSLGLIRIYQEKSLSGRLTGSVSGFSSPDYQLLAQAFGLRYIRIDNNEFTAQIHDFLENLEPCLIEVMVSTSSTCYPEPTYLSTVENQSPILTSEEKRILKEEAKGSE